MTGNTDPAVPRPAHFRNSRRDGIWKWRLIAPSMITKSWRSARASEFSGSLWPTCYWLRGSCHRYPLFREAPHSHAAGGAGDFRGPFPGGAWESILSHANADRGAIIAHRPPLSISTRTPHAPPAVPDQFERETTRVPPVLEPDVVSDFERLWLLWIYRTVFQCRAEWCE